MPGRPFKPKDLTGQVRGHLTAVRIIGKVAGKSGGMIWECRCHCGVLTKVSTSNFTHGHVYSCGCMRRELIGNKSRRHGHFAGNKGSRTYTSWQAMLSRCEYSGDKEYARYGGNGVTICESWHVFENFLSDMGVRPESKSLDRIDGKKGYYPENCRWATALEQRHNTDRYRKFHKTPEI